MQIYNVPALIIFFIAYGLDLLSYSEYYFVSLTSNSLQEPKFPRIGDEQLEQEALFLTKSNSSNYLLDFDNH